MVIWSFLFLYCICHCQKIKRGEFRGHRLALKDEPLTQPLYGKRDPQRDQVPAKELYRQSLAIFDSQLIREPQRGIEAFNIAMEMLRDCSRVDWDDLSKFYRLVDWNLPYSEGDDLRNSIDQCLGSSAMLKKPNPAGIDVTKLKFGWRNEYVAIYILSIEARKEALRASRSNSPITTIKEILESVNPLKDMRDICSRAFEIAEVLAESSRWDEALDIVKLNCCNGQNDQPTCMGHDGAARLIGSYSKGIQGASPFQKSTTLKILKYIKQIWLPVITSMDTLNGQADSLKSAITSLVLHIKRTEPPPRVTLAEAESKFLEIAKRLQKIDDSPTKKRAFNYRIDMSARQISETMEKSKSTHEYVYFKPIIENCFEARKRDGKSALYLLESLLHEYYMLDGDLWRAWECMWNANVIRTRETDADLQFYRENMRKKAYVLFRDIFGDGYKPADQISKLISALSSENS